MPYGIIVLLGSVGLVLYFVFGTEASFVSRATVAGLFLFGLACLFLIAGWSLFGSLLLVGVSVVIILYDACQKSRWLSNRR
jgi:hypothetical protein